MSVVALNAVVAGVVAWSHNNVGSVVLAVSTVAAGNDALNAVALCANILCADATCVVDVC